MQPERKHSLPDIAELLASGGDERTRRGPDGMNKYGCFSTPQPDILSYSSCTASTISEAGFAAAAQLYQRLERVNYVQESERMRSELRALLSLPDAEIILSPSGTDLHHLVARVLANDSLLIVMPETSETGSGVAAALSGDSIELAELASRIENGDLRPPEIIDAEAEALVANAIGKGKRTLLILTDISKTGLTIPSPACAVALKQRFADRLDVLVDGCQLRLGNATINTYLKQNFLVAITGSKFVTGPAFSAALLVPKHMAQRFQGPEAANEGLLLRWEAALAELRAFHALSETAIYHFIERFGDAVQRRLANDPAFEPLATRDIDRGPLVSTQSWDRLQTIFPFRLRHPQSGALLNKTEAAVIYERLKAARFYLGQPVACGALRLCLDMRLIVRGDDAVISDAMRVLDEAVSIMQQPS